MKEKLQIVYLPINDIKPYEKNARKHESLDVNAIATSIQKFGMCDPIGIWSKDNIIVEGHGRLLALKQLGYDTAPCIRLDHLTDEERKAYTLAHNKTAELSSWDQEILIEELESLKESFDLTDLGFSEKEIYKSIRQGDAVDDEFDLDSQTDLIKETKVKKGDIYQLGDHRLMCGSSSSIDDVSMLMGGGF